MQLPDSVERAGIRQEIAPKDMRRLILTHSKRADVGHIGSCLCVVEILSALYGRVLRISSPGDPERDRFVLSKGHAGLALYAALVLKGWVSIEALDTFCGDDSVLGVHPEVGVPGVDFSTGSLGHGLSIASGAALAARLQKSERRVFCLISDAECNEGSTWEAAMFASHHRLDNLKAVVDWNGQQAFGKTCDVLDMSNLRQRWEAFGWSVSEVNGHSCEDLATALAQPSLDHTHEPRVILARTTFGKGVSYMEHGVPVTQNHLPVQAINWHYLPMSDVEYQIALEEVERSR